MLEGTKTFKLIRARSKMNNFSAIYKNYFKVKFLQARQLMLHLFIKSFL